MDKRCVLDYDLLLTDKIQPLMHKSWQSISIPRLCWVLFLAPSIGIDSDGQEQCPELLAASRGQNPTTHAPILPVYLNSETVLDVISCTEYQNSSSIHPRLSSFFFIISYLNLFTLYRLLTPLLLSLIFANRAARRNPIVQESGFHVWYMYRCCEHF